MPTILGIVLLALIAYTAADYTLARGHINDPQRTAIAAVFASLCVLFGVAFWGQRL